MKSRAYKSIISVFLCFFIIGATLASTVSVFASDLIDSRIAAPRKPLSPYESYEGEGATGMNGDWGIRLKLGASFSAVKFKLATYTATDAMARISVYKWLGTYLSSTSTEPQATAYLTLKDNQVQGITLDSPLPAGDYLFTVESPTRAIAMYTYSKVSGFDGYVYNNGYPVTESIYYPVVQVTFSEGAEDYFLPCEKPGDIIDGNHTPPSEYVIPSDSLIYTHEVMPDTWVFTDGLGRVSLTNTEVGDVKDRTLAIFYWTWHIDNQVVGNPVNLQELSEKYPDAMRDYNNSLWKNYSSSAFFWNESIYGYYRSDDAWVLRRQAELLTNAGIDVIFTDNTNGQFTWKNSYNALFEAWDDAMSDGVNTPKISFMLPFGSKSDTNAQVRSIYLDIFRSGRYQNLWFYWDSKPMLMAMGDSFSASSSAADKEILNFFTFRAGQPGYVVSDTALSSWGWLSMYPQALYYKNKSDKLNGSVEQMTVGVAMNHNYALNLIAPMNGYNIAGRSYTSTYQNRYDVEGDEASKWGYNFAEQFNYALSVDPEVIFVTGWNEFTAGRHSFWPEGYASGIQNAFPDQFNNEFSRDIEPTKGELKDHYYYQLVNFSRQYQGVRPIPTPSTSATIDINGSIDQWTSVEPYYAAYIGNTDDRDSDGYGSTHYTETSGRNDIIGAQIARDGEYVYFLVECAKNITPYTDSLWMNLYIDSDQNNQGWNTFEYVLNKSAATKDTLVLERFIADNSYDSEKVADVEYNVDGRYMTVKIKKSDLGLDGDDYTINFSWTDNVHDEGDYTKFSGDIMDFYISGDVAPGGRFKYSYISTSENTGEHQKPISPNDPETPDTPNNPDAPAGDEQTTAENVTAPIENSTEATNDSAINEQKRGCGATVSVFVPIAIIPIAFTLRKKKHSK